MRILTFRIPTALLVAPVLGLLAGCGGSKTAGEAANGPKTFALTGSDTMKYNLTRLEVAPGEDVKVTLTNTGSQPKVAMGHNWTLLQKGADAAAFANAAAAHKDTDYFPTELAGQVLARIKLLGPRESDSVEFKAPTEPGEYPFLCTVPGHYVSGMHGVLVVR